MDDPKNVFREEAYELLTELETSLLELEDRPGDKDLIGRVFRAMHTIKGSGAMFGFTDISSFTHEVESVYDLVREGRMAVSPELVNLSLAARDRIRALLDASVSGEPVDQTENDLIIEALARLRPGADSVQGQERPGAAAQETDRSTGQGKKTKSATYRIRFTPHREIFATGTNPLLLLNELRGLGFTTIVAQSEAIPDLAAIEPESSYLSWDIILTTDQGENAIRDVFIFVEDLCRLSIERISGDSTLAAEEGRKRIGEILVERGDVTNDQILELLRSQKRIGELLVESRTLSRDALNAALAEQQHLKDVQIRSQQAVQSASIRVDAGRLDGLVNLVGELVTVQARLSRRALRDSEPELLAIAEEVERLTCELRDNTMSIRMMPIGATFAKFRRLVRDLSQELGKEVVMSTEGEETELDKTVIEKLNDPFVHLIRNSIDHGIEMPQAREAAGKPRQGTVRLAAVHSGDSVIIEIRDNGKGLDRDLLRRKAVEKGFLAEHEERSDQEIFQLLFLPGFSTAATVSSVSGRGVGMDVVKRSIESLRGSIELSTEPGQGTTVRIRLPLTLAIIETLLVRVGEADFVLPLSAVEECIELRRQATGSNGGRNLINVRGSLVPYIPLRQRFAINGEPPEIQQIVITSINNSRIGFVVDNVVGEHQTVIKSLGPLHRNVRGISGATILGDGSVALIVDVGQIVEDANAEARQSGGPQEKNRGGCP